MRNNEEVKNIIAHQKIVKSHIKSQRICWAYIFMKAEE